MTTLAGSALTVVGLRPSGPVGMVAAAGVRAAGFARSRGAEAAAAEWLVFLDADTRPAANLLELLRSGSGVLWRRGFSRLVRSRNQWPPPRATTSL
jgi:hypothetical protein